MTFINISSNFEEIKDRYAHLQAEINDASEPLRAFGAIILKDIADQFETEGDIFGDPWPPLSHETILRRERKNMRALERKIGKKKAHGLFGQQWVSEVPMLRDTGILFGSIRQLDLSPRSVTIGTDDIRADTHNFGDIARNIPRRQFIPDELTQEEEEELWDIFDRWMSDAIERSGCN